MQRRRDGPIGLQTSSASADTLADVHPPPIGGAAGPTEPTRAPLQALTWALAAELLPPSHPASPRTSDATSGASRPCAQGTPSDGIASIRGVHAVVTAPASPGQPKRGVQTPPRQNCRTRDRDETSMGARGTTERNEQRRRQVAVQRRRERLAGLAVDDAAARWLAEHG